MASCSISGWSGASRTYTLTVTESSYNTKANTSVVSWTLSSTGASTHYDYYLYASVNGTVVFNSSGGWSSAEFPATTGSRSGSMTISHGSDGKKSISFYIEGYAYTYSTKSNSGSLTLTNIDRTAPSVSAGAAYSVSVSSFGIKATSNQTCKQWAWRIKTSNGSYGSWQGWYNSTRTDYSFTISGLTANTSYVVQLAGLKETNEIWGWSNEVSVKTLGASTITSVSNTTIGNNCAVTWTPLNSGFKFRIKYSCGSWNYTTGDIYPGRTSAYTYNYTIPMTVCDQIPNSSTGTLTCVLTTYNGNTQVGSTSSKTATLTVPVSVVPTISSVTLSEGTTSGFGTYVRSLSTVKSVTEASGAYSSKINTIVMTVDGKSYTASSNTATSGVLQKYGTISVKVVVTDSRGRTATTTQDITVYNYFQPTIALENSIVGTTSVTTVSGNIAPVNDLNTKKLVITRTRTSDETTVVYTVDPLSSYDYSEAWTQTVPDIDTETYLYTATVTDKKQSVTVSKQTAIVCISRLGGGKGVTFFQEAKNEGFWVSDIDYTISTYEYKKLATKLARSYVQQQYEKGAFVIHDSKVYELNTELVVPEAWNSSHWDMVSDYIVGTEIIKQPYLAEGLYSKTCTIEGVTWNVNDDGSVTANGTVTGTTHSQFWIGSRNDESALILDSGKYVLRGSPKGGSSTTYYIRSNRTRSDGTSKDYGRDYGDGVEFVVEDSGSRTGVWLNVEVGMTVSNLTFYPSLQRID